MNTGTVWRGMGVTLACGLLAVGSAAWAANGSVFYVGQGFSVDDSGTASINDERCALVDANGADDGGTGQFANWNGSGMPYETGQGYLLWILSANGATSAKLFLPDGAVDMFLTGGNFKYASKYYPYLDLVAGVTAVYQFTGKLKGKVNLVVSHGCQPFAGDENGAWCSPGYWKNASDASWALTGYAKTDLFNNTVVPNFYDTASAANPTLETVLNASGANTYGEASDPFGLNAFNATGAFLTDQIPDYVFDPELYDLPNDDPRREQACPIDKHGNFKAPQE
jgi:hypothetical protein